MPSDKIDVQNIGQPGKVYRVDAVKYAEMRRVMLAALRRPAPGMTMTKVNHSVRPALSALLFPGGETSG